MSIANPSLLLFLIVGSYFEHFRIACVPMSSETGVKRYFGPMTVGHRLDIRQKATGRKAMVGQGSETLLI